MVSVANTLKMFDQWALKRFHFRCVPRLQNDIHPGKTQIPITKLPTLLLTRRNANLECSRQWWIYYLIHKRYVIVASITQYINKLNIEIGCADAVGLWKERHRQQSTRMTLRKLLKSTCIDLYFNVCFLLCAVFNILCCFYSVLSLIMCCSSLCVVCILCVVVFILCCD